jgi:hypothetical protein
MTALEVVIIVAAAVAVVAMAVSAVARRPPRPGRQGQGWIDHPEDIPIEHRASEDEPGEPIPRRRLRGRPEPVAGAPADRSRGSGSRA